jgi:hypothetical protein
MTIDRVSAVPAKACPPLFGIRARSDRSQWIFQSTLSGVGLSEDSPVRVRQSHQLTTSCELMVRRMELGWGADQVDPDDLTGGDGE